MDHPPSGDFPQQPSYQPGAAQRGPHGGLQPPINPHHAASPVPAPNNNTWTWRAAESGMPRHAPMAGPRPTNALAVVSLVLSIVGGMLLCATVVGGVVAIPGAIVGHVARRQIRASGEAGDGLALAAIIVGWIAGVVGVLVGGLVLVYLTFGIGWGNL